jgi:hypothetical protein
MFEINETQVLKGYYSLPPSGNVAIPSSNTSRQAIPVGITAKHLFLQVNNK